MFTASYTKAVICIYIAMLIFRRWKMMKCTPGNCFRSGLSFIARKMERKELRVYPRVKHNILVAVAVTLSTQEGI